MQCPLHISSTHLFLHYSIVSFMRWLREEPRKKIWRSILSVNRKERERKDRKRRRDEKRRKWEEKYTEEAKECSRIIKERETDAYNHPLLILILVLSLFICVSFSPSLTFSISLSLSFSPWLSSSLSLFFPLSFLFFSYFSFSSYFYFLLFFLLFRLLFSLSFFFLSLSSFFVSMSNIFSFKWSFFRFWNSSKNSPFTLLFQNLFPILFLNKKNHSEWSCVDGRLKAWVVWLTCKSLWPVLHK